MIALIPRINKGGSAETKALIYQVLEEASSSASFETPEMAKRLMIERAQREILGTDTVGEKASTGTKTDRLIRGGFIITC